MPTPNLNITDLAAAQANKVITINEALAALDEATQGALALTITAATTLTEEQFRSRFAFELSGTPGSAFALTVPADIRRLFLVVNGTDGACTVTLGTSTVVVATSAAALIYSTGANLAAL